MPVNGDWPLQFGEDAPLLRAARLGFLIHKPARIAVAVSGGSDSMAALHLLARAATHEGWAMHAVTVDHALRPEAADEAAFVARQCVEMGVPHVTLRWQHGEITGNLQDQARRARYGLMADWAAGQGISDVVLGHTADDQAETFLMGLARGAGIDGLVGMRSAWRQSAVQFLRPFMHVSRQQFRDYLARQGVVWVDDPSNADDRFTRVKARRVLKTLKPLGVTVTQLVHVIDNLADARRTVLRAATEAQGRICHADAGEVIFDGKLWKCEAHEVQRRLLIAALCWASGAEYAPRENAVNRAEIAIHQGRDTTLGGCRVRVQADHFRVVREPRAVAGVVCPTDQLWDGRWQLEGPHDPGFQVRVLGADGLRRCKDWRETGHSRDALVASPAVWRRDALIAAPVAGFGAGWSARIVAGFGLFALSH